MIKTTGAQDRIIADAAGITAQVKNHSGARPDIAAGRQVPTVRALARAGLVTVINDWYDGVRNHIIFELTDLGLERALELEALHADPKTGIIPLMTLVNL
jgi:DNA-binding PadR family transcriptional regulator